MRAPAVSILIFAGTAAFLLSPLAVRRERKAAATEAGAPAAATSADYYPPGVVATPSGGETSAGVDFLPAYFALDPAAPVEDASLRAAFNPADAYGGLPPTEGYKLVAARCAACHSLNVVMQQSLPEERWDHLLDWMSESKGMTPLEPEDRRVVLSYLIQHFGARH